MIPKNLLPAGLRACIAGGYAVCPALADDMDVFVFAGRRDVDDLRREIIVHLAESGFEFATETSNTKKDDRYPDALLTKKVARVTLGGEGPSTTAQVMVTDAANEAALIDTFDISTCMVAIRQDGVVIRGEKWTPVTVPPVVIANYPSTQERVDRYTARFGPDNGVPF